MLKPLTSLRFIFALMVLGSHLSVLRNSEVLCEQWLFQNILREGFIGVSFFFILSGFILSYRYQDSLTTKRESKRQFYVARIARIYPLHLLTFLAAIPFVIIKLQPTTSAWLKNGVLNLSLTHSLFIDKNTYFSFNSPSWSISTEMFFYLLFPVLIPILSKVKTRSKQLITILIMGTTLLIAIYLTPQKLHHAFFYISPCFRIFDFMMGIMLYNIFLSIKRQKVSLNSWHELLGIVLLAIFFIFHHKIDPVFRYSIYYWLPMAVIIIIFATS
jgi:peptidoglycan/LPS O-acetylase OafA/YrhL